MIQENYHLPRRLRPVRVVIDPTKRYNKPEIQKILGFTTEQIKMAEKEELIAFFGNITYGIYFFQALLKNKKSFEEIKAGVYVPKKDKDKVKYG